MSEKLVQDLQRLIEAQDNTEFKCREFLQYAKDLLISPDLAIRFIDIEMERHEYLGRSDYVVIANVLRSGDRCRRAYLWELKAPQCYIFEKDTKTRLKPSQEYVDAENKLLNYYYGLKENNLFRQEYDISASSDISLGGIIIGCGRTKVRGNYSETKKIRLYSLAKRVRDQLYDGKIKLRTWDEIYHFIGDGQRRKKVIQNVT